MRAPMNCSARSSLCYRKDSAARSGETSLRRDGPLALTDEAASDFAEGEVCIPINASEQIEFCYARGWTDGLPVVPASRFLVKEMLEAGSLKPDAVIADMPSRKVAVTAEKVAINAVMAGCKAEYMPVV